MRHQTTQNFAPDGLSHGYPAKPDRAMRAGQSSTTAEAGTTNADTYYHGNSSHHDEHGYDDGLVHGHGWAISGRDR